MVDQVNFTVLAKQAAACDGDSLSAAQQAVSGMDSETIRVLAVEAMRQFIDHFRRATVRKIEKEFVPVERQNYLLPLVGPEKSEGKFPPVVHRQYERDCECDQCKALPEGYVYRFHRGTRQSWPLPIEGLIEFLEKGHYPSADERIAVIEHLGPKFKFWLYGIEKPHKDSGLSLMELHELWETGGVTSTDERYQRGLQAAINEFRAGVEKETILKITSELLSSDFALGDGKRVTWGEATIEQHQTRISLLDKMVLGTATTAARHFAAIDVIRRSGAVNLLGVTDAKK